MLNKNLSWVFCSLTLRQCRMIASILYKSHLQQIRFYYGHSKPWELSNHQLKYQQVFSTKCQSLPFCACHVNNIKLCMQGQKQRNIVFLLQNIDSNFKQTSLMMQFNIENFMCPVQDIMSVNSFHLGQWLDKFTFLWPKRLKLYDCHI